jgi:hypothetical protein
LDNDLAQNAQEFRARRCIIIAVLFSYPYCFVIILLLVYDLIPDEIMKALDEYSMVAQYIMRILKKKYKIAQESIVQSRNCFRNGGNNSSEQRAWIFCFDYYS